MNITEEVEDKEVAKLCAQFDVVFVGSDQIWNLRAEDFSWNYFLPFDLPNTKKVAYAASIGVKKIVCSEKEKQDIQTSLNHFDFISVRDISAYNFVNEYANVSNVPIVCDPTLLVDVEKWKKLAYSSKFSVPSEDYILFYDLSRNKDNWILARNISKFLKMPVIITSVPFPRVVHYCASKEFKKILDVGPKEWLLLIDHAKLVLTSSFHGTVFSILFKKDFFTLNSINDYRISHLLKVLSLENRNLTIDNWESVLKNNIRMEYNFIFELLQQEINRSKNIIEQIIE